MCEIECANAQNVFLTYGMGKNVHHNFFRCVLCFRLFIFQYCLKITIYFLLGWELSVMCLHFKHKNETPKCC